jgi:hypothetical protein
VTTVQTNVQTLPFRTLLYRYFFFGWLFKDPNLAQGMERGLVMHHNRRQAAWLPKYMARWLGWCFFLYGAAEVMQAGLEWSVASRLTFAMSAACLGFGVMAATAWLGLTQRQDL